MLNSPVTDKSIFEKNHRNSTYVDSRLLTSEGHHKVALDPEMTPFAYVQDKVNGCFVKVPNNDEAIETEMARQKELFELHTNVK